jgi:hypothetical protein
VLVGSGRGLTGAARWIQPPGLLLFALAVSFGGVEGLKACVRLS